MEWPEFTATIYTEQVPCANMQRIRCPEARSLSILPTIPAIRTQPLEKQGQRGEVACPGSRAVALGDQTMTELTILHLHLPTPHKSPMQKDSINITAEKKAPIHR